MPINPKKALAVVFTLALTVASVLGCANKNPRDCTFKEFLIDRNCV